MTVPYFAQWESRDLVSAFLSGKLHPSDDPLWHLSGASDPDEYAEWSPHMCGIACLKMLLAQQRKQVIPTIALMKECREYGGYVVNEDGAIKGLIYRPFVQFIADVFGLQAEVKEHTPVEDVCRWLEQGHVFIASVHPSIRTPEKIPPHPGGHLVYVFGRDKERREVIFHNPSGDTRASQEQVRLNEAVFARFYAQRGILIQLG